MTPPKQQLFLSKLPELIIWFFWFFFFPNNQVTQRSCTLCYNLLVLGICHYTVSSVLVVKVAVLSSSTAAIDFGCHRHVGQPHILACCLVKGASLECTLCGLVLLTTWASWKGHHLQLSVHVVVQSVVTGIPPHQGNLLPLWTTGGSHPCMFLAFRVSWWCFCSCCIWCWHWEFPNAAFVPAVSDAFVMLLFSVDSVLTLIQVFLIMTMAVL